jgi:predicted CopG family antitoxin
MSESLQSLKVSPETWKVLNSMKEPGDTFDDVVSRLIEQQQN